MPGELDLWEPPLTVPQRQFYRSRARMRLTYGSRGSGKTIGVEHTVLHHGWHNDARIAIILKTTRTGHYGVWPELTRYIFNQWLEAGIGSEVADFGWIKEPHKDSITKIHSAIMWNKYGRGSEIVLFPIEHPADALEKLLSTEWSCVWISEGHLYRDTPTHKARSIFDHALGQLRLKGVPWENTCLFVDTNPPDEGTKHWLYDIFFRERTMNEWPEWFDAAAIEAFKARQQQMEVIRAPLDSNTFLHPGLKAQIIAQYAYDVFAYRRFVLAEWIDGSVSGLFAKVFRRERHVIGSIEYRDQADWEVIAATNGIDAILDGGLPLLICGWDIGDVNHAWVCIQPVYSGDKVQFRVIKEYVVLRSELSVEEFAVLVLEKMRKIEADAGFKVAWRHFSDASAFEFRAAISRKDIPIDAEMTDAALVDAATGGEVILEGSADVKKPGWQRRRVSFMAQLFRENRLFISADCVDIIRMACELRKAGGSMSRTFLDPEQDTKHVFDAASYAISMFALDEILAGDGPRDPDASPNEVLVAA